jgi:hypothetical protein
MNRDKSVPFSTPPGERGKYDRRRLLGHLRRSGSSNSLRDQYSGGTPEARNRDQGRPAHRRMRIARRRHRWGCRAYCGPGGGKSNARGSARLEHSQRPGSGIGASVRGPRHSHPKRNPGRVALVGGCLLIEVLPAKERKRATVRRASLARTCSRYSGTDLILQPHSNRARSVFLR